MKSYKCQGDIVEHGKSTKSVSEEYRDSLFFPIINCRLDFKNVLLQFQLFVINLSFYGAFFKKTMTIRSAVYHFMIVTPSTFAKIY